MCCPCCNREVIINVTGHLVDLGELAERLRPPSGSSQSLGKPSPVIPSQIEQATKLYEKLGGESQKVLAILALAKFLRESEDSCI